MERKEAIEIIKKLYNESLFLKKDKEAMVTLIPELAESEDERIRKFLIQMAQNGHGEDRDWWNKCVAWLEKQGEHAKFLNKIQIGDKVTRNKDGVLVNLSQLNRVAKPADNIEPKFKVGDFIVNDYCMGKVIELTNDAYLLDTGQGIPFSCEHNAHLWTIQDAKDGDVLRIENLTFIFQEITNDNVCHKDAAVAYCSYEDNDDGFGVCGPDCITDLELVTPATKEQHDTLMKAMTDAGYTFDFEKKELKKI